MTADETPYTDQRWRMILLGLIELGLGVLAALGALATTAGVLLSPIVAETTPMRSMVVGVAFYSITAAVLIILGVGSLLSRRWARALSLILGWIGLLTGVFAAVMMVVIMPRIMAAIPPVSDDPMVSLLPMVITIGCVGTIYLAVPLLMILLSSGRAVRLTVEYRDPVKRWTDAAPLPVFGLACYLALIGFSFVAMLANPVLPLFGAIITGLPAAAIALVLSVVVLATAWGIYRLNPGAWWSALALSVAGVVVSYPTFLLMDLRRVYTAMGLWSPAIARMQIDTIYRSPVFLVLMSLFWIVWLTYLLSIRKYFRLVVNPSAPELAPRDGSDDPQPGPQFGG